MSACEHDLTTAVDAAARVFWERLPGRPEATEWADLDPVQRFEIKEVITPVIVAALQADPYVPRHG